MSEIDDQTQLQIRWAHYQVGVRLASQVFEKEPGDLDGAIDHAHRSFPTLAIDSRAIQEKTGFQPSPITARWQLDILRGFVDRAEELLVQAVN